MLSPLCCCLDVLCVDIALVELRGAAAMCLHCADACCLHVDLSSPLPCRCCRCLLWLVRPRRAACIPAAAPRRHPAWWPTWQQECLSCMAPHILHTPQECCPTQTPVVAAPVAAPHPASTRQLLLLSHLLSPSGMVLQPLLQHLGSTSAGTARRAEHRPLL